MRKFILPCAGLLFFSLSNAGSAAENPPPNEAQLLKMTSRFAPVDIKVDTTHLPASEQLALRKMIEASRIFDAIFLKQVAPLNPTYLSALVRDAPPLGRARLHYFSINAGPWSRLDEDAPFIPGVGPKPLAGNFYPADS